MGISPLLQLAATFLILWATPVMSLDLDPTRFQNIAQNNVNYLGKWAVLASQHHPVRTVTPFGWPRGIDIGVMAAVVQVEQEVKDALWAIGVNRENIPQRIPLPQVAITKSLPWALAVGGSFVTYSDVRIWGIDLTWTPAQVSLPAGFYLNGGLRGNFGRAQFLSYIKTKSFSAEGLLALKFPRWIDVYGGVGSLKGQALLSPPAGQLPPFYINLNPKSQNTYGFLGLQAKLMMFRLSTEFFPKGPVKAAMKLSAGF